MLYIFGLLLSMALLGLFFSKDVSVASFQETAVNAKVQNQSFYPPVSSEKKIRIGYLEGEKYVNFAGNFYAILKGLEELGWLEDLQGLPYQEGQEDTSEMWNWLVTNQRSNYVQFVDNAHFSLLGAPYSADEAVHRLTETGDIDFIMAMGTVAGQLLAEKSHSIPTMVFSSSNAVQSGIIESAEDSGKDHVWAHMDIDRYSRQIEVFHDIFEFSTLGMLYEDSDVGRVYAAVDDVQFLAEERGFKITHMYVDEAKSGLDRQERYYPEVLAAFTKLAQEVEAMYITVGTWELDYFTELLAPFYENNVPVFSQLGSEEVAYGALMSVARQDFLEAGLFFAENIGEVFNGKLPRHLPQIYTHVPTIAINLEAAKRIEYQVPFEILLVADEIILATEGEGSRNE
ncbi:ABC-type uncharacterized transport system substrate-binding protein [Bacillus horti]|uniref:ABC-type uncharacterized transport system substrate-binding protein n=1 Tax=Caldalkalibacillus horti TaxID=77523 RepID=A0ABT9W153_9BACI|nr:ABC-type uncharacterized transport system substrate-binding protein [Bacillus horti]